MTKKNCTFACSQQEIDSTISQYAHLFHASFNLEHCSVPKGWLPLLKIALNSAQNYEEECILILHLTVSNNTFHVDFASGSEKAQKMFCSIVSQAESYCPCCGALQEIGV